jgi:hypothetical protein
MPHLHSMTIFDVDRIEIAFDGDCQCYSIKLFEGDDDIESTRINVWRGGGGRPPELIVEGVPQKESAT